MGTPSVQTFAPVQVGGEEAPDAASVGAAEKLLTSWVFYGANLEHTSLFVYTSHFVEVEQLLVLFQYTLCLGW